MSEPDITAVQREWDASRATGRYLHIWTVYDHPSDHPDHIVVRESRMLPGGVHELSPLVTLCASIEQARASIPPGLHCMDERDSTDPNHDPVVLEAWL